MDIIKIEETIGHILKEIEYSSKSKEFEVNNLSFKELEFVRNFFIERGFRSEFYTEIKNKYISVYSKGE